MKAGDLTPLEEARTRAATGPSSARAAWSLVAWALSRAPTPRARRAPLPPPPRRGRRSSSSRASPIGRAPIATRRSSSGWPAPARRRTRPMLEALVRTLPLADETGLRAALYLARDHGRDDLREPLVEAAAGVQARRAARPRRRGALGLGAARCGRKADGARDRARELSRRARRRRGSSGNVAWGALIRAAAKAWRIGRAARRRRPRSAGFSGAGSSRRPAFGVGGRCRSCSRAASPDARSPSAESVRAVTLWADRDDDDADGRPDGEQRVLAAGELASTCVDARRALVGAVLRRRSRGEHARASSGRRGPLPWGTRTSRGRRWFQGLSPGRVELVARTAGEAGCASTIDVRGVDLRDGDGRSVDLARRTRRSSARRRRASKARPDARTTTPTRFAWSSSRRRRRRGARRRSHDRRRVAVAARGARSTRSRASARRGRLAVRTARRERRALLGERARCAFVDRRRRPRPSARAAAARSRRRSAARSSSASDGRKAQMIRVLGPRSSPVGPIGRLRASCARSSCASTPGGRAGHRRHRRRGGRRAPSGARRRRRRSGASAAVTFGDPRSLDVRDRRSPAVAPRLASATTLGLARQRRARSACASTARRSPSRRRRRDARRRRRRRRAAARARRARRRSSRRTRASVPALVAERRRLAAAQGRDARRGRHGPRRPAVDRPDAQRARSAPSTSPTASQHFTDMDATAGTLEERTLLKALDDGDPTHHRGRRRAALRGRRPHRRVVHRQRPVERAQRRPPRPRRHPRAPEQPDPGARARARLLDLPGHPDDYGVDTPTSLMDSDAADASPFGPRRLTVEECARVVRQSGPKARAPLLADWPLAPDPEPR